MDVAELIARESIRDLVARYNSTADSGRLDETAALFAPDAVFDQTEGLYEGSDQIRSLFTGAVDSIADFFGGTTPYLRHCTATLQIDVTSATTAGARCYYFVLMPHGLDHWGRYIDEFGLVDGAWLFTRRRERLDGWAEGGWSAWRRGDR